jgi:hypothetical protein
MSRILIYLGLRRTPNSQLLWRSAWWEQAVFVAVFAVTMLGLTLAFR